MVFFFARRCANLYKYLHACRKIFAPFFSDFTCRFVYYCNLFPTLKKTIYTYLTQYIIFLMVFLFGLFNFLITFIYLKKNLSHLPSFCYQFRYLITIFQAL
uniref:Uncharacterized protein n=1 Tax=Cacopsylla melanoneura TaxID=428564 RepID=A0A8D8WHP8_9HEMI